MTRSCRTSSIPTRSTCSTRRASNMHRHSLLRSDVLEIVFADFPNPQCSPHHFAYLQIHMFYGSHCFTSFFSHCFTSFSRSSRFHKFTFLRPLRFTLFAGPIASFFFQCPRIHMLGVLRVHIILRFSRFTSFFRHCFTSLYSVKFIVEFPRKSLTGMSSNLIGSVILADPISKGMVSIDGIRLSIVCIEN